MLLTTALLIKIVATVIVVLITIAAAERLGPFWGGMIGSFPSTVGPTYVILAIEQGDRYVADAAMASTAGFAASTALAATFAGLAYRRWPGWAVVLGGWGAWLALAVPVRLLAWTPLTALGLNAVVFAAGLALARPIVAVPVAIPPLRRRAYDIPLRALLAGLFVGAVTTAGLLLGPVATGVVTMFPIVYSTLAIILLVRAGPAVTASTFAHTLKPMLALPLALLVVHMTAVPLGSAVALSLGLAICLAWAAFLIGWRRRGAARPATEEADAAV